MSKRKNSTQEAPSLLDALNEQEDDDLELSSEDDSAEDDTEEYPEYGRPLSSDITDTGEEEASSSDDPDRSVRQSSWTSKSGIVWSPDCEMLQYRLSGRARRGVTRYAASRVNDIQSSFDFFITDEIMDIITEMTNLNGRRREEAWKEVDKVEMRSFIGLLILVGVYRSRGEAVASLWAENTGRPVFRATMSAKRFSKLSQNIRFDGKRERKARRRDKLAPIREIWEKWLVRLPMGFNPGEDVCVDEQLVPFRGRCSFRQYMPSKPAKYGLKLWVLCDVATSYAWRMQPYLGKEDPDAPPEKEQGRRVVKELTEGLSGHTVTTDNFFTSHQLGAELLRERKMGLVGTIRRNKPELPPKIICTTGRLARSSRFAHTVDTTVVSYIPKRGRNVILLSTKHRGAEVSGGDKRKPVIIEDYNRCKGAVDNLDKLVLTYSTKRATRRWPVAFFSNMLDVSAYNALVLWLEVSRSWKQGKSFRRRLFLEELGMSLIGPQMASRSRLPVGSVAAALVAEARQPAEAASTSNGRGSRGSAPTKPAPSSSVRRKCHLCCRSDEKQRYARTCCNCRKNICMEHTVTVCTSCLGF